MNVILDRDLKLIAKKLELCIRAPKLQFPEPMTLIQFFPGYYSSYRQLT
jgi:hypothetical protein